MSHLVGIGNQYLDSLLAPECYEICATSYLVNVRDMGVCNDQSGRREEDVVGLRGPEEMGILKQNDFVKGFIIRFPVETVEIRRSKKICSCSKLCSSACIKS